MPVEANGETINTLEDLEIGLLAYLITASRVDGKTKSRIRRLRDIRNRLAHLESLEMSLVLNDDLYSD